MTEDRLQHDLVMWFGQRYPDHIDYFWEVNNNPKNKAHGAYRKSMGMKKNVSDLILIQPQTGKTAGIELKAPGSNWPAKKIENQLNWGNGLIKSGGYYLMSSDSALIKEFINAVMSNNIYIIYESMNKGHNLEKNNIKTIKF